MRSIAGGWLPDLLNRRGMAIGRARFTSMLLRACLVTPTFFASRAPSEWWPIAIIGLAVTAHQG